MDYYQGTHKILLNLITGNPVEPIKCEYGCNTKYGDNGFITDSCPKNKIPLPVQPSQPVNNESYEDKIRRYIPDADVKIVELMMLRRSNQVDLAFKSDNCYKMLMNIYDNCLHLPQTTVKRIFRSKQIIIDGDYFTNNEPQATTKLLRIFDAYGKPFLLKMLDATELEAAGLILEKVINANPSPNYAARHDNVSPMHTPSNKSNFNEFVYDTPVKASISSVPYELKIETELYSNYPKYLLPYSLLDLTTEDIIAYTPIKDRVNIIKSLTTVMITPIYPSVLSYIPLPITPLIALQIFKHIAVALDGLHSLSLTHNDIKPENIFQPANGEFILADLGSVRNIGDRFGPTTLPYHPAEHKTKFPQEFKREEIKTSVYTDYWMLACTLYAMMNNSCGQILPKKQKILEYFNADFECLKDKLKMDL